MYTNGRWIYICSISHSNSSLFTVGTANKISYSGVIGFDADKHFTRSTSYTFIMQESWTLSILFNLIRLTDCTRNDLKCVEGPYIYNTNKTKTLQVIWQKHVWNDCLIFIIDEEASLLALKWKHSIDESAYTGTSPGLPYLVISYSQNVEKLIR